MPRGQMDDIELDLSRHCSDITRKPERRKSPWPCSAENHCVCAGRYDTLGAAYQLRSEESPSPNIPAWLDLSDAAPTKVAATFTCHRYMCLFLAPTQNLFACAKAFFLVAA